MKTVEIKSLKVRISNYLHSDFQINIVYITGEKVIEVVIDPASGSGSGKKGHRSKKR